MRIVNTSLADVLNPYARTLNSAYTGGSGNIFVCSIGLSERPLTWLALELLPSAKKTLFSLDIQASGNPVLYFYENVDVSGYIGERYAFHNTDRGSSETSIVEMQEVSSMLNGTLLGFDRYYPYNICSFVLDTGCTCGIVINGTPHRLNMTAVSFEFTPVPNTEYRTA